MDLLGSLQPASLIRHCPRGRSWASQYHSANADRHQCHPYPITRKVQGRGRSLGQIRPEKGRWMTMHRSGESGCASSEREGRWVDWECGLLRRRWCDATFLLYLYDGRLYDITDFSVSAATIGERLIDRLRDARGIGVDLATSKGDLARKDEGELGSRRDLISRRHIKSVLFFWFTL